MTAKYPGVAKECDTIITNTLTGRASVAQGTRQLDALQVRGGFDMIARTFTGYDYANQRWIERRVGG